jgi:Lar family restriction alleviation protein
MANKYGFDPCPFCKGEDIFLAGLTMDGPELWASCFSCGAKGPVILDGNRDKAVELWNKRFI